ncbi:MAG: YibE/F family protein [Lachnospiraceae bacterium]|nr:YibE/F family protein [Lachnospiraceae bacterium]
MKMKKRMPLLKKGKIMGLLLVFAAVFVFMQYNAFLYQDTVVRVTSVDNTFSYDSEGPDGDVERYYDQSMKARILNGEKKGAEISLSNTYSDSGVNDESYRKGDRLFVSVSKDVKTGTILGKKRDVYLVMLICIFLFLLLLLNEKRGGIIFASLLINISVFLSALSMYGQGGKLISIAFALMLVFSILTLLFAGGFHKKTFAAILSTLLTTLLCYGIYEIVLHSCKRLPYEMMDYVVNSADLSDLFLTGVLMGSLGAVMDVSISIAAGVAEIIKQTPDISMKALIRSVREMGYDIMGTMINVLFFTYISGAIPILVVKIKNGYTLYHLVNFQLIFEIIRFLMGAIGIVLAIPVSGLCAVLLLHMGNRNEEGQVK